MKINDKIHRWIKLGAFIVYISVLIYFLFFADMLGRTSSVNSYRYNLVPFKEIRRFIVYSGHLGASSVFTNLIGNVVAFIPFGIFLPILTNNSLKIFQVTLFTFALTLSIELIQLMSRVGIFDVDDIILNTLGGIIGYLMFFVWKSIKERKKFKS